MRFKDSCNLPKPILRAIEYMEKSHNPPSDISCTQLIDAPLRSWLKNKYNDYIVEEASDRLWALYGSLAHLVVEKFGKSSGEHAEKTVIADIFGWKVSATLDYVLEGEKLIDYKFTSVWSTAEGVKPEWEAQLNVGLYLSRNCNDEKMREIGKNIHKLEICALFRDWSPRNSDEFPNKIQPLAVSVWSNEKAKAYVEGRVKLHQAASNTDVIPPICSDQERWMSDFAIMSKKKKNAMKAKIKTREEAEQLLTELGGDYIREAKPKRCADYCSYGKQGFCPYWDGFAQETRVEPVIASAPKESPLDDPDHKRKEGGPNV